MTTTALKSYRFAALYIIDGFEWLGCVYGFIEGGNGVRSSLEIAHIFFSIYFEKVKNANIRLFWDTRPPITTVAYYRFSDMIYDGPLMKSFAGFLHLLVIQ